MVGHVTAAASMRPRQSHAAVLSPPGPGRQPPRCHGAVSVTVTCHTIRVKRQTLRGYATQMELPPFRVSRAVHGVPSAPPLLRGSRGSASGGMRRTPNSVHFACLALHR